MGRVTQCPLPPVMEIHPALEFVPVPLTVRSVNLVLVPVSATRTPFWLPVAKVHPITEFPVPLIVKMLAVLGRVSVTPGEQITVTLLLLMATAVCADWSPVTQMTLPAAGVAAMPAVPAATTDVQLPSAPPPAFPSCDAICMFVPS